MTATPVLGLTELAETQAGKSLSHNEALRNIEALTRVISRTTTAEPGAPSDGDAYIIPASATGTVWTTFSEGSLTYFSGDVWVEKDPSDASVEGEGWRVWCDDEDVLVVYDGSAWVPYDNRYVLTGQTTDATPTELFLQTGSSARLTVPASTTWIFEALCVARQSAGGAGTVDDSAWAHFTGALNRDGSNNTTLVGSVSAVAAGADGATSWTFAFTADDTNEALIMTVTGEASKTVDWTAHVHLIERA